MKKSLPNLIMLIMTGLALIGPVNSLEARAKRQKKEHRNHNGRGARIGGVLFGAAAGGGIAAGVGSAKWAALGVPLGGLAGYFLVRAIQRGRNKNNAPKNNQSRPMGYKNNRYNQ